MKIEVERMSQRLHAESNPKKRRYESHIEEINARARAQGKSYGQLQAEKLLARLHEEMSGVRA